MGERAIIRQGDRTSHGGTVLEGHLFLTIHGKPAAGVGHKVHCPKCSGSVVIAEGALNATMMGISIAVDGMKTSCGATLIASQITDTIEYGSGSSPAAAATQVASAASATLAAIVAGAGQRAAKTDNADNCKYDEQVRVLDQDGAPIANMPYHITDESGQVYKGLTDADGCCERVHTKDVQSLAILTGVLALEKWQ